MATGVPVRERPLTILIRLVAAQVGQIASENLFSQPIRRLQIVLQTQDLQPGYRADDAKRFAGAYDAFRRSGAELGLRSLWRGTTMTVASASALQLASLVVGRVVRDPIDEALGADEALATDPLSWRAFALFSFGASALTGLAWLPLYPLHLAATLQSADLAKEPRFDDPLDTLARLYERGRAAALFAGVWPKLAGMVADRLVQHVLIILLVRALRLDEADSNPTPLALFVGTQLMAIVSRTLNYPFELVARRMQVQAGLDAPVYASAMECARDLTDDWKRPLGLWRHFGQCAALDAVYAFGALGTVPVNRMLAWALNVRLADDEDEDEDEDDGDAPRRRRAEPNYDDDDDDDDDDDE